MSVIQGWVDGAMRFLDKLWGPTLVRHHFQVRDLDAHLTGYSIAQYELRVFCQEKRYTRRYLRWPWPTLTYSVFRVFGQVTNDAPESLQRACRNLDLHVPRLMPGFFNKDVQQEAAIRAYLDILAQNIKDDTGTYNPMV